jgi:16S rRNA (cytosine967-C5)-methyltransferase
MQRLLAPGEVPPPTLRVRPGRTLDLSEGQAEHISGGAFRFLAGGDPRRDEGFARGDFVVQELGAQRVAEALRVLPGERVLDVCAGRGQKSSLLVDQGARVLATDLHPHKLSQLEDEFDRLGLECETAVHDWTTAPPLAWQGAFDAVLVDAPCSGVGTLRRRPEILRRIGPETPARLAELQEAILRQASLTLAEGGRLLFATCSVLREEGEEVVQRIADVLVPRPFASSDPSGAGQEALFRLLPGKDGTDGYFLAQLERRPGTRSL